MFSQELICNGGFEDKNTCTEYRKECAPEAWIGTSLFDNYYFEDAKAHQGEHFVGLTAGNISIPGRRNFIRTRLVCGLRKDHQYKLEFYVFSTHPFLDSIGVYFSPEDFLYEKRNFTALTPQLWSTDGLESPRPKNPEVWQKVHFIYTATGKEGYMTIGSFKRLDYTGIRKGDYRTDYYFFLDDISFTPVDSTEKLCLQADSVRNAIYEENERHDYLQQRVRFYTRNPPTAWPLPPTRMPVIPKIQHIDTLIIPDIFFTTASHELSPNSFHLLDSFATALGKFTIDSLVIEGHTDSIGKLVYNQQLSENRAIAVKEYVSAKAMAVTEKTVTRGYAYLRPVATNKTPAGRQQNRRVEIFVYRKE